MSKGPEAQSGKINVDRAQSMRQRMHQDKAERRLKTGCDSDYGRLH